MEHPITPPPGLIDKWRQEYTTNYSLARQAARWGADQELEACCKWTAERTTQWLDGTWPADALRAARRPKPPSLKEQALDVIENSEICDHLSPEHAAILRRALEQLDD